VLDAKPDIAIAAEALAEEPPTPKGLDTNVLENDGGKTSILFQTFTGLVFWKCGHDALLRYSELWAEDLSISKMAGLVVSTGLQTRFPAFKT